MISAVRSAVASHADTTIENSIPEPQHVEPEPERHLSDDAAELGAKVAQQIDSAEKKSRDARGRFSKAEAEPPEYDLTELSKSIAAEIHEQAKAKAPTSWSEAAKAQFALLGPEVQAAVLKREAEITKGQQQYADGRYRLDSIEEVMAQRRESYQKFGFKTDAEAISHVFALSDELERDPSGVAIRFLQAMPPAHVERVRQALGVAPPQQQMDAYAQERVQQALAVAEVQRWEQTAGEHYGLVKDLMRQILEKGYAQDLDSAYKMAVANHPAALSIEKQRRDRERIQSKVRANSASLNGSPYGVASAVKSQPANNKHDDIAGDIRAAINSLM
jgi:hypothetical protein